MADTSNLTNFLEDVADAIRAKKGTQAPISAASFDTEISSISTVNNQNKTVTENGVVTPDTGYTGLGEVTVNVDSIPDGIFIQEETPTKTTDEAIWLKEDSNTSLPLDEIPSNLVISSRVWSDVYARLSQNMINTLNNCNYILIIQYGSSGYIYGTNSIPIKNDSSAYTINYKAYVTVYTSDLAEHLSESNDRMSYNSTTVLFTNFDFILGDDTIHYSDVNEPGIHIDVDDTRYIVHTNKSSNWDKILDTSNANATASDILTGKTAFVNNTKLTGTMLNNGALNYTPSTTAQTIPAGYTSGGTVSGDANLVQANIRSGVTIFGVEGNLEPDKPDQTKTVTPSATSQTIEPDVGYELSSVTVNPIPLNIYCQRSRWRWYLGHNK